MDNTAIERIARPDLGADAKALLERFGGDDDVVFFLGRLVWQGEMAECLPDLLKVALDPARGRYARIASIRAVMTIGDESQKDALWSAIAAHPGPLDRCLLAEVLEWAAAAMRSVELLLVTLDRLEPYERFEATGLSEAIHGFIDRLPAMANGAPEHPIARFVEGLNGFLDREPHMERGECHVSEEFAWLMAPAFHAVDRLVSTRSEHALKSDAVAILRKVPAVRFWRSGEVAEYRTSLRENVPRWQELNDLLYWTSVAERRLHLAKKGERLTEDWQIAFMHPFWKFGPGDFDHCLAWVDEKPELDDRLVAMARCTTLFIEAERPANWLERLRAVAAGEPELEAALEARLYPKPSPAVERMEADHRKWEKQHKAREAKEQRDRANWISTLKADPRRVRNPEGLKPGEFSHDQFYLMMSIKDEGGSRDREWGADWRALTPEFGAEVSEAYRDAALAHWRHYRPELRSEGAEAGSTPYAVIFGLAGIAIEASETEDFSKKLSLEEVQHLFRYLTWELNGFPSWFEALYRAHPTIGFEAVEKEVLWELENSTADAPTHHILHDLLYHAPWLHGAVAPMLLDWLSGHDMPNADNLRYCLTILSSAGLPASDLARLAENKLGGAALAGQRPTWFALWADNEPDTAIPALEAELAPMEETAASAFAQQFIVALLGDRHGTGNRTGAFKTADHLKNLYILMHRFIKAKEDIERAGKGVYSPTLRDNAQDARNNLFSLLSSVPGPDTYAAIKALEKEHPEPSYRRWMAKRARERAIEDADEPLWNAGQVHAFASRF
jgi:hypothetical protein